MFSVMMPAYSAERYIEKAVESIMGRAKKCRGPALLGERLINASWYHWPNAAMLVGQRQFFSASGHLALSFLLNPRYVVRKIWRQYLSPQARRSLKVAPH